MDNITVESSKSLKSNGYYEEGETITIPIEYTHIPFLRMCIPILISNGTSIETIKQICNGKAPDYMIDQLINKV
jgi:hypothetical protein